MQSKKIIKILIILIILLSFVFVIYHKFFNIEKIAVSEPIKEEVSNYSSNIITDVEYTTTDNDGNEYTITSIQGEIDFNTPNIIFLTKVKALIKLNDSNEITITSEYKYNSNNFDTIFQKCN